MHTQTIEYYDNGTLLEGFLAYDDKSAEKRPAVLIAHPWAGRDQAICNRAVQMAELGYVGFAGDMYGKGIIGTNTDENSALMQPFIDNRGLLQARMLTALETLRQQPLVNPEQVAALGYCFGGMCVLDLARSGVQFSGTICVHGLLQAPPDIQQDSTITARILVLHGYQDPLAPSEDVTALQTELTKRKADWQIHLYGNTMHAFTNPLANDIAFGTVYNASADKRSCYNIRGFLDEVFNTNQ
ncbi:MAG TPA: dienelactone hydrolase family protein [Crenotrichaceae bacterium]|nr:dienelactone hydrolase family protein [Crenotrichaceae bacterium]